jgi:EmrB/QacA subfamily drug resistance transporter
MGSFVALLDSTVVNVALPAVENDLGGGLAGQQWVVNAYMLVLGSLILVGGRLGDVFGERKVFSLGVGGFGLASILCALAPSIEVLVGARAIQGLFGAMLTPSALAVIVNTFAPSERGAAIGTWTAWTGIAAVAGPLGGGLIIDQASWRWIFAINVPFVVATLVLVAIAVPQRSLEGERPAVDWLGGVLCALGLAGPVYALIRQPDLGWGASGVAGPLLAGVALLGLFLWHEERTPDPMLPLSLFRRRNFAIGNAETLTCRSSSSSWSCSCSRSPGGARCRPAWRRCRRPWSCSSCRATAAAWPIASGRACSWAAGRSSPPRGCCSCSASAPTPTTSPTCSRP